MRYTWNLFPRSLDVSVAPDPKGTGNAGYASKGWRSSIRSYSPGLPKTSLILNKRLTETSHLPFDRLTALSDAKHAQGPE